MKIWITKYALTKGILVVDADVSSEYPDMVSWGEGDTCNHAHGEGRDWHWTQESAKARAGEMIDKKIISLEKSIAKLKKLRPKNVWVRG